MFRTPFLDIPHLLSAAGDVTLPGSKSISNRVLLLCALCEGETTVHDLLDSDDTRVMLDALRSLGCGLRRDGVYRPQPGWSSLLWRLAVANVCMALALWWFTGDLARWLATPPLQRALYLAVGVMFGVVVYGAALYATGVRPADLRNRSASV